MGGTTAREPAEGDLLARFDRQLRRDAGEEAPGGRVVRRAGGADGWSGVLWSDLDEETADAEIRAQIRHFAGLGPGGFEWKLYAHDRPADLGERLRAAGFAAEPVETVMVAAVGDLPRDAGPPEGIELVPVTDAAGVERVAEVHESAFGPGRVRIREQLLAQLEAGPDAVAAVLAMAGRTPVSAARIELYPGTEFAGLWGGGTVPGWRGRGIYRALVAYRTRLAAERGVRHLQVDASAHSEPILRRLGFAPLTTTTPWVHPG
ncbi:GNAT family N-acetyltransferase [Streptomyces sp. SBT349]|uniref:GNAT family N-acetyltransferase n=1 Tax=Streptomyces sp. SBT349 TaxID=1580539 RepID=UPI00066E6421|nr:N-acetyltransferase [Streptomyces sp. SBT349]